MRVLCRTFPLPSKSVPTRKTTGVFCATARPQNRRRTNAHFRTKPPHAADYSERGAWARRMLRVLDRESAWNCKSGKIAAETVLLHTVGEHRRVCRITVEASAAR